VHWRARAAIVAFLFGFGMGGCDCVGCSSKEVARAEGKGWSIALSCEANTRLGGVGAGHAGGILYPDGCNVGWEVNVEGGKERVKASLRGPSIDSHACSEVRAFCKKAKGTVAKRAEGEDMVVGASTGEEALGFYILQPGQPFQWPSKGVAANDEKPAGTVGKAVAAGSAGDPQVLLAAMPPVEALITQMLGGAIPLDEKMLPALEGPRLERHLLEVRTAIGRCVIPVKVIDRVAHVHAEVADEVYAAAFPRVLSERGCTHAREWLLASKPKGVAPRVVEDLRTCGAACPSERLEDLAVLVDSLESKEGAALLTKYLTAPRADAWTKDENEARSAFTAWHAAAYAVAHLDPATARGLLLAQVLSASTRGIRAMGDDDDDDDDDADAGDAGDAGRKADASAVAPRDAGAPLEEGINDYDLPLEKPTSCIIAGGSWAVTLRDLAELLLLTDDPSVRDALFIVARDAKRDRGVRQIAIAYLVAVHDPRGDTLFTESKILTPGQRGKLQPPPPPPPPTTTTTTDPGPTRSTPHRRRHHHH
jgi:hypothetical protein